MTAAIQRSFTGGELSHALGARADLIKYQTGARKIENGVVTPDGGVAGRAGSYFVAKTKLLEIGAGLYAYAPVRPIEWQFNTSNQAYILEMGPEYIRFHQNGALVRVTDVDEWDNAEAYVPGDLVEYGGVNYYCIAASTGDQPPDADYWYPLEDDIFEIPTEYSLEDVLELQETQQGDTMTFVHKDHLPADLVRTAHTGWTLTDTEEFGALGIYFHTKIAAPTGLATNQAVGAGIQYTVTAVSEGGEEGRGASVSTTHVPSSGSPTIVTWNAVTGAFGYNVYRTDSNGLGLLGFTTSATFTDFGILTDLSELPAAFRTEFATDPVLFTGFPSVIANFQQRRFLANLYPHVYDVWGSRVGVLDNFDKKRPALADSSMRFQVMGRFISEIRHLVDAGVLMAFTAEGEAVIKGDSNEVLRPGEARADFKSFNGASSLRPLVVGSSVLYVQDSGSFVRSAGFDIANGGRDGYIDSDLSAESRHLIKGKTIEAWAYQKAPYSMVNMARSDGMALGLTIVKEHQIKAWTRHSTQGNYQSFACIKENGNDSMYQVVQREIDGETIQFIERQAEREFTDIRDAMFLDCALSYDGRNTDDDHTMRLEGYEWEANGELTLHSSAAFFTADDVGNVIQYTGVDDSGNAYRLNLKITEYIGTTSVLVRTDRDVPEAMESEELADWVRAVNVISGLDHLEGEEVGVMADGTPISAPLHPKYPTLTVEEGELDFGEECYGVIHVGLPYKGEIETLDLETVNSETLSNKHMLVNEVTVFVEDTMGLMAGTKFPTGSDPTEGLTEMKAQDVSYGGIGMVNGKVKLTLHASWTMNGHIVLRQLLPLPWKVNAIVPTGFIAGGG